MSAFSWFEEVAAVCPRLGARSPASPEAIEEAAARVLVPPALRALYARSDGLGRPEVSRAAELGRLGPHDDPEAREELPAGLLVIGRLHDLDLIVLDVTVRDGPVGVWDPETPGTLRKKAPSLEVWLVRAVFDDVPRAVRATLVHRLREITSLADRATEEQLHHRHEALACARDHLVEAWRCGGGEVDLRRLRDLLASFGAAYSGELVATAAALAESDPGAVLATWDQPALDRAAQRSSTDDAQCLALWTALDAHLQGSPDLRAVVVAARRLALLPADPVHDDARLALLERAERLDPSEVAVRTSVCAAVSFYAVRARHPDLEERVRALTARRS